MILDSSFSYHTARDDGLWSVENGQIKRETIQLNSWWKGEHQKNGEAQDSIEYSLEQETVA
jgi:hypothetical protein